MEENKECKCSCKCKKGVIYWLVVILGVGFIFWASIKLGNTLANEKCDCPTCETEEQIKTASKDRYEFNFYDGAIPGGKYTGFIDLKTGLVKVTYEQGCSVPGTCTNLEPDVVEGNISNATLNKIIDYLEKVNYPTIELNTTTDSADKELRKNMSSLIYYAMLEAKGNKNISIANEGLDRLLK